MKEKKFRELEIAKYFMTLPAIYIEKWLLLGQSDQLISTIYFTIRDLFTNIKA